MNDTTFQLIKPVEHIVNPVFNRKSLFTYHTGKRQNISAATGMQEIVKCKRIGLFFPFQLHHISGLKVSWMMPANCFFHYT